MTFAAAGGGGGGAAGDGLQARVGAARGGGGSPRISAPSRAAVNRRRSSSSSAAAGGDEDEDMFDAHSRKLPRRNASKGKTGKGTRGASFAGSEVDKLLDIYENLLPFGQQERDHATTLYNQG